jgi:3-hydroxybutyryl-CoA dehydrogenase
MAREIRTVGVVGLGTMGAGIVEVFAKNGLSVVGLEISPDALERGRGHLDSSTGRAVKRGKLTEAEQAELIGRVTFTTSYDDLAVCDLVVEAVPELMKLKRAVFSELDRVCPPHAVLATNTSSLSVTEIAMTTSRPASVIGMHFFNPAPVMKLVEVVHSVLTEPETLDSVRALAERIGKTPVVVGDRAGFVANYLLFGYLNRAVATYASGYVGREDLDTAMRTGAGLPMGPLTLLDLIGNDTAVEILETMYAQTRDRLHVPHPLLKQLVAVGSLGRKSGRGFYAYDKPGSGTVTDAPDTTAAVADVDLPASVAVAGDNPLAQGWVDLLEAAGVTVVRGGADDVIALAKTGVVVEALAADAGAQREFVTALAAAGGDSVTVLVAGPRGDLTSLAAAAAPAQVLGFHALESTKHGRVVEIVSTLATSDLTRALGTALAARLDLITIHVGDRAGYVVGSLLFPYINDAIRMVESGYASVDDVDHAMTLGCGYPYGPIAMADFLGLDRVLEMQERVYDEEREPGLAPSTLLRSMVTTGRLGARTGRGFRVHEHSRTYESA